MYLYDFVRVSTRNGQNMFPFGFSYFFARSTEKLNYVYFGVAWIQLYSFSYKYYFIIMFIRNAVYYSNSYVFNIFSMKDERIIYTQACTPDKEVTG